MANFKLKSVAAFTAMMLTAPNALGLGLGSLEVQSNLDQPFSGEIELRVDSGDDIRSIVATIASEKDFSDLNIDYPSYLSDMKLTLESVGGNNVLRVSSNGVVIKEPFIHFLVRVNWSGGSFLREYTALIDPPVYASETPSGISQPRAVGVDQSSQTSGTQNNLSSSNLQSNSSGRVLDGQYGPVGRGESLSQIARDLQQQFPDLSIYQIMKVLFDENNNSFIDGNINGLMEGAVLNVANINTIRSVDIAESKQFYLDQINAWDPSSLVADTDSSVKIGQDDYIYNEDNQIGGDLGSSATDDGNDTFLVGATSDGQALASAAQGSDAGEVIALQQQVSDLQTTLSSSSLENQELKERISILEGQLADMNRLMSLNVEDADLASLESSLANQNNLDETIDSELESANDFALSTDESVDEFLLDETGGEDLLSADGSLVDDALSAGGSLVDDTLSAGDSLIDDTLSAGDSLIDDTLSVGDTLIDDTLSAGDTLIDDTLSAGGDLVDDVIEETPVEDKPAVVSLSSKPSFFDSILSGGLWKIIVPIIAAVLGLFVWRRRKADEEFEVSMMTIESHDSESVTTKTVDGKSVSVPADQSQTVVDSKNEDSKAATQNEETSFLTVYSDSDAVVQADEVDPIAEADVYIAYGREEQAEEVLLDGVASSPDRIDIKQKLLNLYFKAENGQGFERIAEELYAQKDSMEPSVWQEVSQMGKTLLPTNPMFDMSADELFVDTKGTDEQASEDQAAENVETAESDVIEFTDNNVQQDSSDESDDDQDRIHSVNLDDISDAEEVEISELNVEGLDDIKLDDSAAVANEEASDIEGITESLVQEVSDLDIDADYDEARTQYELAKVFVDLGDEDGARKILNDIVDNKNNAEDVLSDAAKLLESIG